MDAHTGPNIAACCCVNGRGLSMFDFRMPLPLDFIYDVSCSPCCVHSTKHEPLGLVPQKMVKFNPARIKPNFKHWVFLSKYRMQPKFTKCC